MLLIIINLIEYTLSLIIVVVSDFVIVAAIFVAVWGLRQIAEHLGMGKLYLVDALFTVSEIGLLVVYIIFVCSDTYLTYNLIYHKVLEKK
ncbi:MAG: hypothetical protein ACE5KE_03660 [Methanosarcinales archaeon]